MSSLSSPLTEEQRARIERNRQEALAKRARLQPQTAQHASSGKAPAPLQPRPAAMQAPQAPSTWASPSPARLQHQLPVENVDASEAAAIEQAMRAAQQRAQPRPQPLQPQQRPPPQQHLVHQPQHQMKPPHRPPDVAVENVDESEAAAIEQAMRAAQQKAQTLARPSQPHSHQAMPAQEPSKPAAVTTGPAFAISFNVTDRGMIKAMCGYNAAVIDVFKTMKTRSYDKDTRTWSFQLQEHDELVKKLRGLGNVTVTALPPSVLKSLSASGCSPMGKGAAPVISDAEVESKLSTLPPDLWAQLMPFQRDGVKFAVKHGGRALIGDEMGLGKTLQGIAIAKVYESQWPCLVIVPSALRLVWRNELERWLPDLVEHDSLSVIMKGSEGAP